MREAVIVALLCAGVALPAAPQERASGRPALTAELERAGHIGDDPTYQQVLETYQARETLAPRQVRLELPATQYAAATPGSVRVASEVGGRSEPVLAWEREDTWLEYAFDVPAEGLYQVELEYYPLPGERGDIRRALLVDGRFVFRELRSLRLPRTWKDAHPPRRDNQGNHVRPRQVEHPVWRTVVLSDPEGMQRDPFLFHFTEGRHTLRFLAIKEPMALATIAVVSPPALPGYESVLARHTEHGRQPASGELIAIQGEHTSLKSDPTLRMEHSSHLTVEPPAGQHRLLNVFGSWRWRRGGQFATWEFTIAEPGLYQIAMNVYQPWNSGLPSVRSIRIDGRYPFAEMREVAIPFARQRQLFRLGGDEEPYLFWFDEGRHSLTMTVTVGAVSSVIRTIENVVREASRLQRKVILITGVDPDPNREWDTLTESVPQLVPSLTRMAEDLEVQREVLVELSRSSRPPAANTLAIARDQLLSMARDPASVPYRQDELSSTLSSLVGWLLELKVQPLQLDWIAIAAPDAPFPRVRPNIFERIAAAWNTFLASFTRDYTVVGDRYDEDPEALTVWIARGREWAEVIKQLADETFTTDTGIRVNVNVLPAGVGIGGGGTQALLLQAVIGSAPDVALGVEPVLPVEFGIRNGLVNLNEFPDYPEVAKRFRPGALIPYHFRGADYALPENQSFSMLFYRTDILAELSLSVPQTWDDVYQLLPELQRNGLDFYYTGVAAIPGVVHPGLLPFLLQNGGQFYNENHLSALGDPVALRAFTQWTELYTNWRIPMEANFFNRMRTGEMPIGVADYFVYVQLHTSAPELTGWWEMAPIPGVHRPDGTIDRSAGGAGQVAVIFKQSDQHGEAWEFLKWWTSADIQTRFGEELEALLGVEARWNTANVEALRRLPWPNEDINAILEQWQWFEEQPMVLGGYFTNRHVQNAWNRVVLQGENPREALEIAVEDINTELRRKQREFGFRPPPLEPPELPAAIQELVDRRQE